MDFSIGAYDKASSSVPVVFTHQGIVHARSVNAVLTDKGAYDRSATRERVEQVGNGVAVKIEAGVITNAPPASSPETESEAS